MFDDPRFPKLKDKLDRNRRRYAIYRTDGRGSGFHPNRWSSYPELPTEPINRPDCRAEAERYAAALDRDGRARLSEHLRLPVWALDHLALIGFKEPSPTESRKDWRSGQWTFPERDGAGRVVGIATRLVNSDEKRFVPGTHRGLTVPDRWDQGDGPVFVVEGATDVLAMTAAGLAAIGRPSNIGGVGDLAVLLSGLSPGRLIVVVGENDWKPDGRCPGRAGAYLTASRLAEVLGRPVKWAMTPDGMKDVRAWLAKAAVGRSGRPSARRDRWNTVGRQLAEGLLTAAVTCFPTPPSLTAPLCEPKRCARPQRVLLAESGDPPSHGNRSSGDGVRTAADFKCGGMRCPTCAAVKLNRWASLLYRCVLGWADPLSMPDGIEPIESAPEADTRGPWTLAVRLAESRTAGGFADFVKTHNKANIRRVEYARVHANLDAEPDGSERTGPSADSLAPPVAALMRQRQYASGPVHLIVAAFAPDIGPPRAFLPVDPATAIRLLGYALRRLASPPADSPEGECRRYRPVAASEGWRLPPPAECRSGKHVRKGKRRASVRAIDDARRLLGLPPCESRLAPRPDDPGHVIDQTRWAPKGFDSPVVAEAFDELVTMADHDLDGETLASVFRPWMPLLQGVPVDNAGAAMGPAVLTVFKQAVEPQLKAALMKGTHVFDSATVAGQLAIACMSDGSTQSCRADDHRQQAEVAALAHEIVESLRSVPRSERGDWPPWMAFIPGPRRPRRSRIDYTASANGLKVQYVDVQKTIGR